MIVSVVPDFHERVVPASLIASASSPSTMLPSANLIASPSLSIPLRLIVAPFSSSPLTFCLWISTSITIASSIMTTISVPSAYAVSPIFVILPFSTTNVISVVIWYPLGADSSWRIYVPSTTLLISVVSLPEIHESVAPDAFRI